MSSSTPTTSNPKFSAPTTSSTTASNPAFVLRKSQILNGVDLSPKGSIDTPILPLVNLINSHDSACTTSCCSGRISVFLDGELSSTGKGGGGRWVLVSHDPVEVEEALETVWREMSEVAAEEESSNSSRRFLHLKFEPMLLHIQTATLPLAQSLISTSLSTGFRESGIMNSISYPMLAIRTQSLNLDCIIGVTSTSFTSSSSSNSVTIHPLVTRSYLRLLFNVCNERFVENKKKMDKIHAALKGVLFPKPVESNWEDAETRARRKREEGLARAEGVRREKEEKRRLKAEAEAVAATASREEKATEEVI